MKTARTRQLHAALRKIAEDGHQNASWFLYWITGEKVGWMDTDHVPDWPPPEAQQAVLEGGLGEPLEVDRWGVKLGRALRELREGDVVHSGDVEIEK